MTEAIISNKYLGGIARLSILLMLAVLAALTSSAQAAPFAYITDGGSDTVSVIDTATNTVAATVPVGGEPAGVAVNPAGTRVYVANQGSGTVSVIDTATNTVVATVPVGFQPVAFGEFIQRAPTSVEQCLNGGWMQFNTPRTFKNQGDCIRFVTTGR